MCSGPYPIFIYLPYVYTYPIYILTLYMLTLYIYLPYIYVQCPLMLNRDLATALHKPIMITLSFYCRNTETRLYQI